MPFRHKARRQSAIQVVSIIRTMKRFNSLVQKMGARPLLTYGSMLAAVFAIYLLVGLELNPSILRGKGHAAIAISHATIVVPFLLGSIFSLILYPRFSTSAVSFTSFSLFLGVSMSVTASPVLARILTDRGISRTGLGSLALTCAAVDDVSAWCLLALVVAITQSTAGHALSTLGLAAVYILFMAVAMRPLANWATPQFDKRGRLTQGALALVLLLILLSAFTTEWIGIHAIFGAFVLGVIIPYDSALAKDLRAKLEDFKVVSFQPSSLSPDCVPGLLVGRCRNLDILPAYHWCGIPWQIWRQCLGSQGQRLGLA